MFTFSVHTKFCPLDLYGEEMNQGPPMSFPKVKSRKEKKHTGKKRSAWTIHSHFIFSILNTNKHINTHDHQRHFF